MKTLLKLLFIVVCAGLIITCDKSEEIFDRNVELKSGHSHAVTVPFKADFIGEYVNFIVGPDAGCEEGYNCRVFVDFEGNATHLGKMHGGFEFCACGPDDPNIEGEDRQYLPSISYMVAANGDSLFISCWGSVIQGRADDHPEHVKSYWRDDFVILGGTGQFEGASGGGKTDDYNSELDPNSHHHWKGTITMIKGKRK